MKKKTLTINYEYDFVLIGISCHSRDYRLCWEINRRLDIKMERADDVVVEDKMKEFALYRFTKEDENTIIELVTNRSRGGYLVPEQKQADCFLKIKGAVAYKSKNETIIALKSISLILTAFEINPENLKSKQNLLLF